MIHVFQLKETMASFTPEQFQELLQALRPQPTQNDPSALGPMKPFVLGTNKMTRLKRFEEWLEDANSRMQYIGTHDDAAKIILLKTWAGTELVEYMKIHAKVYFEAKPATDTDNAIAADTFNQIITKTKEEMRKSVNRTLDAQAHGNKTRRPSLDGLHQRPRKQGSHTIL